MSKKILHIVAGGSDWEPTIEELNSLIDLFETAIKSGEDLVVMATRHDVTVNIIDIDDLGAIAVSVIKPIKGD